MLKVYQGYITKFLVRKNDWALALFYAQGEEKLKIKIKGNIATMHLRQLYEISGQLDVKENNYAFDVKTFNLIILAQKKEAIKYLTSDSDKKLSFEMATNVINQLGQSWVAKIQENPQVLATITNLNADSIAHIRQKIEKDYSKSIIENKFQRLALNLNVYQKLKKITIDEVHLTSVLEDGFLVWAFDKDLGSVKDLDAIDQAFNSKTNPIERLAVWLTWTVRQILWSTGNTYTTLQTLKNEIKNNYLEFNNQILNHSLLYAKSQKWMFLTNQKIYSNESWLDENEIVHKIKSMNNFSNKILSSAVEDLIKKTEDKVGKLLEISNFKFDENQRACLEKLKDYKILIINGGPGTGKSTLILGLAILFRLLKPKAKINITTPTGRSSIRLKTMIPDFNPMTLHRLLEFKENEFHRNEKKPLDSNLIIIDEMSMVDNHLFASLLRASTSLSRLILVGDIDQLPPINYGDIFNDLVSSNQFITCHLKNNHRQKQKSGIIKLAQAIRENKLDKIDWKNLSQVEFITNENLKDLITLKLDYSSYYNKPNFDVMSYQIVAPTYKGLGGIDFINQTFQSEFNDYFKLREKIYIQGSNYYTIKDKIICNKNFPEYDLANGEIGLIKELELDNNELISGYADFGGKNIPLDKEIFNSLSLCYACSIHKTQGSEYKKVALILKDGMRGNVFFNKKLIYTAVTRAKNELLIIGQREIFIEVASQQATPRLSTILEKLSI